METRDQLDGPTARYIHHGDNRPSAEKLSGLANRLSASNKPASRLFAADVLIDLAMAQPGNGRPIERAGAELTSLLDDVNLMQEEGYEREHIRLAAFGVSAALRLGELTNWREAAEGQDITNDYENFLTLAWQASQLTAVNGQALPFLMEGVPVLLGRRAQALHGTGWASRLSLLREDQNIFSIKGMNSNWDFGVASDVSAGAYDKPEQKFQVKAARSSKSSGYRRAGIHVMSAESLGFRMAPRIIKSCMKEMDPSSVRRRSKQPQFLSGGEIDELTQKIADVIEADRHKQGDE